MADYYISLLDTPTGTATLYRGKYLICNTPMLVQCTRPECWPKSSGGPSSDEDASLLSPEDTYVLAHPSMLQLRKFLARSLVMIHANVDVKFETAEEYQSYYDYFATRLTYIMTLSDVPEVKQLCRNLSEELEQLKEHLGPFKDDFHDQVQSAAKLLGEVMGATVLLGALKQLVR
jgi:hypothetical protein